MSNPSVSRSSSLSMAELHRRFIALLPQIRSHAAKVFAHLKCRFEKDDAIAEVISLAWKWFVQLARRGKDVADFAAAFARFTARAVRCGRRLCGAQKPKDVLSPWAQRLRNFSVCPLPDQSVLEGNRLDEALHDNTQTPVPDQVAFRQDFPAWLTTRTDRDRRLIEDLMVGERTCVVARKFGLSPARVSQLRQEYHQDWERYCGVEDGVAGVANVVA
jgi:hypothetical protein